MSSIAYVNGRYLPLERASVSIEDRGFQFGDGVYEFIRLIDGYLADFQGHIDRLAVSMRAIQLIEPVERRVLELIIAETIRRNRVTQGAIYIQVSRGQARRNHAFPKGTSSSLVVVVYPPLASLKQLQQGIAVSITPDNRWQRCDIKTISLVANVFAKQQAVLAGMGEVWYIDSDGFITEGASSNAWIIDSKGILRTHPVGFKILHGVTRHGVLELARQLGITVDQTPFTMDDIRQAKEALLSSSSCFLLPIIKVDSQVINQGRPGPIYRQLDQAYRRRAVGDQARKVDSLWLEPSLDQSVDGNA